MTALAIVFAGIFFLTTCRYAWIADCAEKEVEELREDIAALTAKGKSA